MPHPVVANFDTVDQQFPKDTVASYLLTLTLQQAPNADGSTPAPVTVTGTGKLGSTSITIADVPAGTYLGSIALVDASGANLAPAVSDPAPLTVVDTVQTISIPVPSTLSLTLP